MMGCEALVMLLAGVSCVWLVFDNHYQVGACENVGALVRNVFTDLLAAILALMLAGRAPPPPDRG